MICKVPFILTLALLLAGCMLVGCESPPAPQHAVAPQPAPTYDTTPVLTGRHETGVPNRLALFGDEPQTEPVPFETRLVTNLTQHSFTAEGLDFDPDVNTADGILVYASTRNSEHPDIFLKSIDGYTITQLTSDPADDIQPRLSPDAKRIVFCSNRGSSWDIWMINRDGTGLTQLSSDQSDEVAPCWSPDGKRIAYTQWGGRSRQWEIWMLDVAQPGTRRFLAYGMFPAWGPDGKHIAFQRARQRGSRLFSVWTIELTDNEARRPTEIAHSDGAACIAPRWSPEGDMLVYCAVRNDVDPAISSSATPRLADIWVADVKTGVKMKLTDGADAAFNPVWGGDGRIFFVSPRAGTENIYSLTTEFADYVRTPDKTPRVSQGNTTVTSGIQKD